MKTRRWVGLFGLLAAGMLSCALGTGIPVSDGGTDATAEAGGDAPCTDCGGQCVDLTSNSQHCGSCSNACPAGAICSSSKCLCQSYKKLCGTQCVDTQNDVQNCGTCGYVCGGDAGAGDSGVAGSWTCVNGACQIGCPGTLQACSGACYDLSKDTQHCGSCTIDCTPGSCCASNCADTTSDNANCGTCGNACLATQACSTGHCCATGQTWCTSLCTDTNTDPKNCGTCGNPCGAGLTCKGGKCCGAPPAGTCSHSLCTTGAALKKACSSCATSVCTADSFCCLTLWDSLCVSEVATYCSPYSCSGC